MYAVIKTIKESKSDDVAKEALMKRFGLTLIQSEAILEMKLKIILFPDARGERSEGRPLRVRSRVRQRHGGAEEEW